MTTTQIGLVDWRLPVSGPDAVVLAAELGVDGLQVDLGGPGRAPELDGVDRLRELRSTSTDVLQLDLIRTPRSQSRAIHSVRSTTKEPAPVAARSEPCVSTTPSPVALWRPTKAEAQAGQP
ncbi:hypothetical protein Aglo03_40590 [Actinokineospora globicatena]|uniref:Xylose isomerase-like TIM barrel n=1 Tax=Actinokineospora globicatena TaxID=103729 RepID=A0A9W6VBS3_9PSEU|nr:hypothetical protein Aglo03_40590 [Actinokineospora globicatena]